MKIVVCVKRVLDHNIKARLTSDGRGVDLSGMKMSVNPFDEVAVEEAIRLKEKGVATELIAVSVGTKASEETLRSALALGMDRAVLVEIPQENAAEPLVIAKILKAFAGKEKADAVFFGKQAIDDDCGQVGPMTAALLGWNQATFASKIERRDETHFSVTREVEGGLETLVLSVPFVLSADLRLNTPRYAALPNILKAKKKLLETLSPEALGIPFPAASVLETVSYRAPAPRKGGVRLETVGDLVNVLSEKGGLS